MKCKNCGHEVQVGNLFCDVCGNKIETQSFTNDNSEYQMNTSQSEQQSSIPGNQVSQTNYDPKNLMESNNQTAYSQYPNNDFSSAPRVNSTLNHENRKPMNPILKIIGIVTILFFGIPILISIVNLMIGNTKKEITFENYNYKINSKYEVEITDDKLSLVDKRNKVVALTQMEDTEFSTIERIIKTSPSLVGQIFQQMSNEEFSIGILEEQVIDGTTLYVGKVTGTSQNGRVVIYETPKNTVATTFYLYGEGSFDERIFENIMKNLLTFKEQN